MDRGSLTKLYADKTIEVERYLNLIQILYLEH